MHTGLCAETDILEVLPPEAWAAVSSNHHERGISIGNVKILSDFQNKYWQRQAASAAINIVCERGAGVGTLDRCLAQRKPKQFSIWQLREYQEQCAKMMGTTATAGPSKVASSLILCQNQNIRNDK